MRLIGLAVVLAIGVALTPLDVQAQQANVPRIGILSWWPSSPAIVQGFREAFREVGYVDGQNIVIEYRWVEEKADRAAALAAELVKLNVNVLVAQATPAIKPAQDATRTIPIVVLAADPIGSGHVPSLARPG
jgi:putative ABC transport system substrate-binding protein